MDPYWPENPFEAVDPIIFAWAKQHGLEISTHYKDYQVRSCDVPCHKRIFQLWVEPPTEDDLVVVKTCYHAIPWNKRICHSITASTKNIENALDEMLYWIQAH